MRSLFLSFASLALVLFSAPIISAQSPQTETDTTAYEYDTPERQVRTSDDSPTEDNARTYDERDLKIVEEDDADTSDLEGETLPGEGKGGSVDPLSNPELFQQLQKCPDCEKIKKELEDAKKEFEDLEKAKGGLDQKIEDAGKSLDEAREGLDDAKKALDDFQNPKSYAESEGRRTDSSDIAAQRWAYGNAWTAYQNGGMTAQELQDFWKDFDDADLQKAKEGYKAKLKKDIENAEKRVKNAEAKKDQLEKQKEKVEEAIEATKKKIERLEKQLEDCLKKCGPSPLDSFFDIFYRLTMPDVPGVLDRTQGLLELPLPLPPSPFFPLLPQPEPLDADSFFDIFTRIDLPSDPTRVPTEQQEEIEQKVGGGGNANVDSFFDIAFKLDLPSELIEVPIELVQLDLVGTQPIPIAVCPKCQSILDKVNAKDKAITAMQNAQQALRAKSGKLDQAITKAEDRVKNLQEALDRMENPKSWAESEGRRVDSADLEARRAAFADAWGRYRGGQITAQELEQYWENFDDAERDKWKEKVKEDLKQKIKNAENAVKQLKTDKEKVEKEIADLEAKIEKAKQEKDQLQKEYDECVKKCKDASTPPSLLDHLNGFLEGIFGPRPIDVPEMLQEVVDLVVTPPLVLPAPANDVAPEDEAETESRMIVFENLDIYVPKGGSVEFTLPVTPEQREYLEVKLDDVVIEETEDGKVSVNPEALLPHPELSTDGRGGVTVSNIGSSGQDGVSIDLNDLNLKGQLVNPNPSGNDYLEGFEIDTSGIGGLGGAQVIGFDKDGKRVILRDNVQIIPEENGGARIEFNTPITVSPGSPVEIVIPTQQTQTTETEVEIKLPPSDFVPSDNNPYIFGVGPQGGTINGPGAGDPDKGTGSIFLPAGTEPKPNIPIIEYNPQGSFKKDIIGPKKWMAPESSSSSYYTPSAGFDPISDLSQGFLMGNIELAGNGNFVINNLGSSGQDGVRISDNLGSSGQDGVEIQGGTSEEGGGLWNSGSGTLTITDSTITGNHTQIGHGGGIFNNRGNLSINNSTITGNQVSSEGGGIFNGGGVLNINSQGGFSYTPPTNSIGTDRFDHTQIGHGGVNSIDNTETEEEIDFFNPMLVRVFDDISRQRLAQLSFGIVGPNTFIPVDPSGLDGRPGLTFDDLSKLNTCLERGGSSCNGLSVGSASGIGGLPFSGGIEPSDFEVVAGPPTGQDFDWNTVPGNKATSEGGGLWNADGPNASRPVNSNFFEGQTGSIQGSGFDDQGGGGIFNDGGGIFNAGANGNFQFFGSGFEGGLESNSDFLPGPPDGSFPSGNPFLDNSGLDINGGSPLGDDILAPNTPPAPPTAQKLPPQVQALIRKIIQQNPLGPCDELVIDVTRVRVGNQYQFTVTAKIQKKPNCPEEESDRVMCAPGKQGENIRDSNCGGVCRPNQACEPTFPLDEIPAAANCFYCRDKEGILPPGNEIFIDGFESGDTSAWPGELPGSVVTPTPKCESGQFTDDACNGACGPFNRCVPTNQDKTCFECIGKPGDIGEPEKGCKNNADCNDADACTNDRCSGGECVNTPVNTSDGDECTRDFCDPQTGEVTHRPIPGCGEPVCVPSCSGRTCGSDGCGGSCGQCDGGDVCNSAGRCESEKITCPANSYESSGECSQCPSGCTSSPGSVGSNSCSCPTSQPACPSGTTADRAGCNEYCTNGVCLQTATAGETACVQCYQCPSGMFTDKGSCESSSGQACEVGSTSGSMQCWRPMPSCENACAQHGFSASPIDFTAHVESQLNAVSCVSSYQMQIQQARVGNCECHPTEPPQITFDRTPPVCKGTVCGDVACGQSTSCATGENQTTTVTCNWGGWQKESLYKYRPILGGQ